MKLAIPVIITLFLATQSAYGDVTLKCHWMVKTKITKEKEKNDNVERTKFRKELFSSSPSNCVEFQYNNYGIKDMTKDQWSQLSESYERPAKINLSCPDGYTPANDLTWGLIAGVTRQHIYQTYYLDSYIAELPCVAVQIPKI